MGSPFTWALNGSSRGPEGINWINRKAVIGLEEGEKHKEKRVGRRRRETKNHLSSH